MEKNGESDQDSTVNAATNKSEFKDSNSIETQTKPKTTTPEYTCRLAMMLLSTGPTKGTKKERPQGRNQ